MHALTATTHLRRLTALAGLLGAAACSPGAVSSERNDAVPIPSGATVAFRGATTDPGAPANPAVTNDSVHHMIRRAVTTQLRQKGYAVVDSAQPSTFSVRYYLVVKADKVGYAPTAGGVSGPKVGGYGAYGYGYGPGYANFENQPLDSMKNVTFEAALVDDKMGRTAWRGVFNAEPKTKTPSEARVNSVVAEVFKTLPKVP